MVEKLVDKWVGYMIENGAKKNQKEVYAYGLICTIYELISDGILLLLAAFLHRTAEMLGWIILFNILRIHIGGYHAETPGRCLLGSTLTGIACVLVYPIYMGKPWLLYISMIIIWGITWTIAPVTHPRHSVSRSNLSKTKKRARILVLLLTGIILLTRQRYEPIAAFLTTTLLVSCLLSLIGKYTNDMHNTSTGD